jgi:hypothetical protein
MAKTIKSSGTSKSGNAKVNKAAGAMKSKVSQLNKRADQQPHGAKNPPPGPGKPKGVR